MEKVKFLLDQIEQAGETLKKENQQLKNKVKELNDPARQQKTQERIKQLEDRVVELEKQISNYRTQESNYEARLTQLHKLLETSDIPSGPTKEKIGFDTPTLQPKVQNGSPSPKPSPSLDPTSESSLEQEKIEENKPSDPNKLKDTPPWERWDDQTSKTDFFESEEDPFFSTEAKEDDQSFSKNLKQI